MIDQQTHDDLVARLYASALGEMPWRSALGHIADAFGSDSSLLQISRNSQVLGFEVHGYSHEFGIQFYTSEIYRNDPRVPYFQKVRPGTVYYDHMLYDVEQMKRDQAVRASEDALDAFYQLGCVVEFPDGGTGGLAVLLPRSCGHPDADAVAAFQRLLPHVQQSAALGQIIQQGAATRDVLLEALAAKADGLILLGFDGKPNFVNDAAQAILSSGDGLALASGQFVTRRGPETRRLQTIIRDALLKPLEGRMGQGSQMLVTRPSGRRAYIVRVIPAPPTEKFLTAHSIACVIHLHDLAAVRLPSKETLQAVFGLSARESDLAVELVRCAGLPHAAASAGMAVNTARNHLQAIFRKCGISSQAEAVQLFGRLL